MIPPGPGFVGLLRERARRSPARGFQGLQAPLGPPKIRPRRWEFRTAKRESRPGRRTFLRRSAKADPGGRLCPGPGFWPRDRPRRRRKRFASLYRAEKPVFTKRRRSGDGKSLFVRRFVACFFAPGERNWRCRRGKSPPPETPAAPRRPRPTTATGSRFLRRQRKRPPRRPRPSPPAREGSLGAPNDRTFPPGAERKARKEKGKEESRMKRAPPL